MKKHIIPIVGLFVVLFLYMSKTEEKHELGDATSEHFSVGEVWRYNTRPGEEESTIHIGKIDSSALLGTIIHIRVIDLKIKSPMRADGIATSAGHLPISEEALLASVTTLESNGAELDGFHEGYEMWREANGGVFTKSVAEIIGYLEESMAAPE